MKEGRRVVWVGDANFGAAFFGLCRGVRSLDVFVREVELRYQVKAEVKGQTVYLYRRGSDKLLAAVEFPVGVSPALPARSWWGTPECGE